METYKYILDDLAERFGVVIDWTSENVMPQIQQLCTEIVTYKATIYLGWAIALGILVIIVAALLVRLYKINYQNYDENLECIVSLGTIFIVLPLIALTVWFTMQYVKTQTAPSLVVIDYLNKFIR